MNFEQLTQAMNNTYIIVTDQEQASIIASGAASHVIQTNGGQRLKDKKVLKFEQLSEQDLIDWDMDPETDAAYVVVDCD